MAEPLITLHDDAGDEIVGPIALPTATPGTPTAETVASVRNNAAAGDPVDPARNVKLTVAGRLAGSSDEYLADELVALVSGAVQVRVSAVSGGADAPITGWRPLGAGRAIALGEIPDGGIVTLGIRTAAPLPASLVDLELAFAVESRQSTPLPAGAYELVGNFVHDGRPGGLPDPDFTEVRSITGTLDPGTADDTVDIWTEVVYTLAGMERSFTPSPAEIVFTAVDGDATTLASGEAYYAAITLDGTDTPNVTKGSKAAAPLTEDDRPTPPADELLAGWVVVPFGLAIDDVEDVLALGFFGLVELGGLDVSIGGGRAAVGGRWVDTQTPTTITLADDQVSTIYRQPETGLEAVEVGTPPTDPRSMALWDVETDSGAIIATTDRRRIGTEARGGTLYSAAITLGAAAAGSQPVSVQLRDGAGAEMGVTAVDFYLSDSDDGSAPSTTAPDGGIASGGDGAVVTADDLSGRLVSDSGGLISITVDESTSGVWHLVVLIGGRLTVSPPIEPTP